MQLHHQVVVALSMYYIIFIKTENIDVDEIKRLMKLGELYAHIY